MNHVLFVKTFVWYEVFNFLVMWLFSELMTHAFVGRWVFCNIMYNNFEYVSNLNCVWFCWMFRCRFSPTVELNIVLSICMKQGLGLKMFSSNKWIIFLRNDLRSQGINNVLYILIGVQLIKNLGTRVLVRFYPLLIIIVLIMLLNVNWFYFLFFYRIVDCMQFY